MSKYLRWCLPILISLVSITSQGQHAMGVSTGNTLTFMEKKEGLAVIV